MSRNILLISVEAPEIRIAQTRDGELFDLMIERDARILNSIFKGRVANVVNGMDAAFVDIGLKRNALLYINDIFPASTEETSQTEITKLVKPGDELIVQVVRPPVGAKGARVTTRISLPGRYTILSTKDSKSGISKRIEVKEERERLRNIAKEIRPADHGIILRTEAINASKEELQRDVGTVQKLLEEILSNIELQKKQVPALLHREAGLLGRIVRDHLNESIEEVWIDSLEEFETFLSLVEVIAPELADRIHLYQGARSLFDRFGINDEITLAQERTVPTAHGATIVIDETEALCAIDVNTGRYTGKAALADTALQANLAAAEAAARQIRLRNISGIIVIDFIEMKRPEDRKAIVSALETALKHDRRYTKIVQLSPSGLVEITRRRESLSLRQLFKRPCPHCAGDGKIQSPATTAIEARRQLREFALEIHESQPENQSDQELISVTLHPEAACAFLGYGNEYALQLENAAQAQVWLNADPSFHHEGIQIESFRQRTFAEGATNLLLEVGKTFSLPIQSARFPMKEPRFIVVHNRLVLIENMRFLESIIDSNTEKAIYISITAVGRWYASGRVLREAEIKDE